MAFNKPNKLAKLYIGEPQTADPTDLSSFKWDITLVDKGTTDINQNNDITRSDYNIYGALKALTLMVDSKTTFEVTQLVTPNADPLTWYSRLRKISMTPEHQFRNVSILVQAYVDEDQTVLLDDAYFCKHAEMSVDGGIDFGPAGEPREITIEMGEVVPGYIIQSITGEPTEPSTPRVLVQPFMQATRLTTFEELLEDNGSELEGGDVKIEVNNKEYKLEDEIPKDLTEGKLTITSENKFASVQKTVKFHREISELDIEDVIVNHSSKQPLSKMLETLKVKSTLNGKPVEYEMFIGGLKYLPEDKLKEGEYILTLKTVTSNPAEDSVKLIIK